MSDLVALKPGTILADDYRIERSLGAGGFGITYLAEEIALARRVTIKEYFPVDFAARDQAEDVVPRSQGSAGDYSWGLDRFLAEAQTLARFNHPNIVRVYRFFQARNTGYIVLHYEEGSSLKGWLKSLGRAPRQPELDRLLTPLLDALETVHAAEYLHRDIAPDNIMIRRDGQPVLIDFGSARGDIAKHSKTISALVKPGYSPYEQYATIAKQQGPWTDIYSLGATLYEAVAGRRPPDAPSRMVADEMVPTADAALSSYRPRFLAAIDKALRLDIGERPRTVAEWRAELLAPAPKRAEPRKKTGPSVVAEAVAAAPSVRAGAATAVDEAVAVVSERAGAVARGDGPPSGERSAPKPSGGLAAAFLEGWRRAAPSGEVPEAVGDPEPVAEVAEPQPKPKPAAREREAKRAQAKPAAEPTPPVEPAARQSDPRRSLFARRRETAVAVVPVAAREPVPEPAPEPGARKATPRALRKRPRENRLWGAVLYLLLALFIAAAVVAVQDYIPRVKREGGGLLTGKTNTDVSLVRVQDGRRRGVVTGRSGTVSDQR